MGIYRIGFCVVKNSSFGKSLAGAKDMDDRFFTILGNAIKFYPAFKNNKKGISLVTHGEDITPLGTCFFMAFFSQCFDCLHIDTVKQGAFFDGFYNVHGSALILNITWEALGLFRIRSREDYKVKSTQINLK